MTITDNQTNLVSVSDITADGFWVRCPLKDIYISRKRYPWFRDATDEEIRDVSFLQEAGEHHQNMLFWHTLGVDFDSESIEKPELIYHNTRVRCVLRPDLFTNLS